MFWNQDPSGTVDRSHAIEQLTLFYREGGGAWIVLPGD